MMGYSIPLPSSPTGPVATSWFVSCLLHAVLAIAAVFFVQRIQLAPQTEPFQWDVAVVAPLSTSVKAEPAAQQTALPAPAVQPATIPAKTARPTTQPVDPATMGSVASSTPAAIVRSLPESYQEQLLHNHPSSSSPASPLMTESLSDIAPQPPSETLSEQITAPRDDSMAPTDSPTTTDSTLVPFASSNQINSAKADYGWLAAIMAQWIEDLNKRYPAMLRAEGIRGKVTLAATLHENGRLSDVRIVRSSGYPALDQVAVEDVTNGPLITLFRPLDRAQVPVKFSISYDLKTAR